MSKFWQEHQNKKLYEWQKAVEDKTGSATFCILPWIHVATRPNGDARVCCGSNASQATKGIYDSGIVKKENGEPANFGRENLLSAFNNEYMKDIRKSMLNGMIPLSCAKCFEEESKGIVSKRAWENIYWDQQDLDFGKMIEETTIDGEVPPVVRYLDLRLGNGCNLKCVMCTPHDSSRWLQDHSKLVSNTKSEVVLNQIRWNKEYHNNYWYERPELWTEIFDQIPNIKQLYFAGGEPLMIKEHFRFLEEIVNRGYSQSITLRYNSNGLLLNEAVIDLWNKFKDVRFAFSIDALTERNHYIRYPAEWDIIEKNLERLDDTPDNIKIGIACAVQIFNIKHIIDFAKWKIKKNFRKINKFKVDGFEAGGGIINMHMLYIPTFLSARILPKEDKEQLVKDLLNFKSWLWENYTQDDVFWKENPYGWKRWESIIKFVNSEDHSFLVNDFKEYTKNLDLIRGTNASEIFPELAHLLN